MVDFDRNAVPFGEMSVKLRHAETNGKAARTAFNIKTAISELWHELLDLEGPDETKHEVISGMLQVITEQNNGVNDPDYAIAMGVEVLVNYGRQFESVDPNDNAMTILREIADIYEDQILGEKLSELLATIATPTRIVKIAE